MNLHRLVYTLEGIVEAPFMLEDPDVFMEELINTPKAFGQMKEEIEKGNQNIMGILTTEASWGIALASLGAAAKRNAAIEKSNARMTDDVAELTERMNKCSSDRSCFLAGSLVETKTGKKAIEEIEEGEEVWCEEENTKEQKLKKVLRKIEKTNNILYHLYMGNEEIHTTEDHAIWLEGEGWRKAEDVHVGDIVRCRTGEPEKITNVWMEKLPEPVKVYNLSVEDVHNYYVSEKGVLVHNECPKNNKVNIESGTYTVSQAKIEHVLTDHTFGRMKKTIDALMKKGLTETAENLLNKKSFFNPEWSEEKVTKVVNYVYNEALSKGITNENYTAIIFGEKITVCFKDGQFHTAYGEYKCSLFDFGY